MFFLVLTQPNCKTYYGKCNVILTFISKSELLKYMYAINSEQLYQRQFYFIMFIIVRTMFVEKKP